jgi:hypothetical protein
MQGNLKRFERPFIYLMGSVAAYWTLERVSVAFGFLSS